LQAAPGEAPVASPAAAVSQGDKLAAAVPVTKEELPQQPAKRIVEAGFFKTVQFNLTLFFSLAAGHGDRFIK